MIFKNWICNECLVKPLLIYSYFIWLYISYTFQQLSYDKIAYFTPIGMWLKCNKLIINYLNVKWFILILLYSNWWTHNTKALTIWYSVVKAFSLLNCLIAEGMSNWWSFLHSVRSVPTLSSLWIIISLPWIIDFKFSDSFASNKKNFPVKLLILFLALS